MAELLYAFTTTAGNEFQKKRDTSGRIYHVKKGDGQIRKESYSAAHQSFSKPVLTGGQLPEAIREADTVQELERLTEIPFNRDTFTPVGGNEESKEAALRAESNRFLGFWSKNSHLDREEAAREYLRFRNEIDGVRSGSARAAIRNKYNLGGS